MDCCAEVDLTKEAVSDVQEDMSERLLDLELDPGTPFSLFGFCLHRRLARLVALLVMMPTYPAQML